MRYKTNYFVELKKKKKLYLAWKMIDEIPCGQSREEIYSMGHTIMFFWKKLKKLTRKETVNLNFPAKF